MVRRGQPITLERVPVIKKLIGWSAQHDRANQTKTEKCTKRKNMTMNGAGQIQMKLTAEIRGGLPGQWAENKLISSHGIPAMKTQKGKIVLQCEHWQLCSFPIPC
jgi:hypothetical protein